MAFQEPKTIRPLKRRRKWIVFDSGWQRAPQSLFTPPSRLMKSQKNRRHQGLRLK
jgi:hypothetical protein